MTTMTDVGAAFAERMEAAGLAKLTVSKVGPVWKVSYGDARGSASVTSTDPRIAAASVARELGIA